MILPFIESEEEDDPFGLLIDMYNSFVIVTLAVLFGAVAYAIWVLL